MLAADACLRALWQDGWLRAARRRPGRRRCTSRPIRPPSRPPTEISSPPPSSSCCAGPGSLGLLGVDAPAAGRSVAPPGRLLRLPRRWRPSRRSSSNGATTWSTACRCPTAAPTPVPTRCPGIRRARACPTSIRPTRPRSTATTRPCWWQLTGAVARLLPSLDPRPVATERCVYDNSADADFVLDRVRQRSSSGAAPAGTPSSSGRCWASCWPTWPRSRQPSVDLARFSLRRDVSAPAGPRRPAAR